MTTTTTDLPPAAAQALIRRAQDIMILTRTVALVIDELEINPVQNLILTSKVLAVVIDRLGRELIGPERVLTDEEMKIGEDFIEALPDDLDSIDQFVEVFKARLELVR